MDNENEDDQIEQLQINDENNQAEADPEFIDQTNEDEFNNNMEDNH